jgi:hypothetical protein
MVVSYEALCLRLSCRDCNCGVRLQTFSDRDGISAQYRCWPGGTNAGPLLGECTNRLKSLDFPKMLLEVCLLQLSQKALRFQPDHGYLVRFSRTMSPDQPHRVVMREAEPAGKTITISAADPLNLVSCCAWRTGYRLTVTFRDGVAFCPKKRRLTLPPATRNLRLLLVTLYL